MKKCVLAFVVLTSLLLIEKSESRVNIHKIRKHSEQNK